MCVPLYNHLRLFTYLVHLTASLVLSVRGGLISRFTSTRTTLPVSQCPACWPAPLLELMWSMWLSTVRSPLHSCRYSLLTGTVGMSGLTSQPSMGAVCGALEQTGLGTGISHTNIQALNLYWSSVRTLYSCFEANVKASDSGVFDHEMPGGQ